MVPLVLRTTTGLISPPFHIIFDDYFTATKCFHSNVLPPNFSALCSTSSEKIVDDTFDSTPFIDSSWYSDTLSSSQREHLTTLPSSLKEQLLTSSTFQRETCIDSTSSLTVPIDYLPSPEVDSISPSIGSVSSPSSGWNNNHRYQTRFKQHHSANIAASISTILPSILPLMSPFIMPSLLFKIHTQSNLS